MSKRYKTSDISNKDFAEIVSPNYVITGPAGYFERVDSWSNARWTKDVRKAFSGLFGDCQNEVVIRGLKGVEIRMK